jgi:peptide deformylase
MSDIIQEGNDGLRAQAADIPVKDITSPRIQEVIERMSAALRATTNGVALAAPQIGESLRMFIVAGAIFSPRNSEGELLEHLPDLVFINPTLTKVSKKREWVDEGCLSVEYMHGQVERAVEASITAYDREGKKFSMDGTGLLAQIFQHEVEHLDGILFIDKARDLERLSPEEWK